MNIIIMSSSSLRKVVLLTGKYCIKCHDNLGWEGFGEHEKERGVGRKRKNKGEGREKGKGEGRGSREKFEFFLVQESCCMGEEG